MTRWAPSCRRLTLGASNVWEVDAAQYPVDSARRSRHRRRALALLHHRQGPRRRGRRSRAHADLRQDLAQVPGRSFLTYALDPALRRIAPGSFARDCSALHLFAQSLQGRRYRIGTVREGKSLADSLTNTGVFPDLSTEMISVGEQTGALAADAQFRCGIF